MRKLKENIKKVALEVIFRLRNEELFFKIESDIKKKGYIIESFGEIDKKSFEFCNLEKKIEEIKLNYGNKTKIILISNIRDVLMTAFRKLNTEIDNFIYFIDKVNYSILKETEYKEFAMFKDIEKETIKNLKK